MTDRHARDKSWVSSANDPASDFPIQNLPYGIFSSAKNPKPHPCVAIGDQVLDLWHLESAGLVGSTTSRGPVFSQTTLNGFMAAGQNVWKSVRRQIQDFLSIENKIGDDLRDRALVPARNVDLHLPIEIGDYTDFYASRFHAERVGALFRDPQNALPTNWLHMPVAYNGRSSSVIVSGTPVQRPCGQIATSSGNPPTYGPSTRLDFELELATIVGVSSTLGKPIPISEAADHIFGFSLMNDWSARDIQQWEYVPLGPFGGKSFATTLSPWIVPASALSAFRVAGAKHEPEPLPYLRQSNPQAFDANLIVTLEPHNGGSTVVSRTNSQNLYWSAEQQIAHHTVSGCNLRTGDVLGSGTISGKDADSAGCLLELTMNGKDPLHLSDGESRRYLEDGDTVTMSGWCQADDYRIGFGEASGKILPASPQ